MIYIGINPVIFSVGSVEVRWYGVMVVLAILAIIAITLVEAKRVGVSLDHIYSLAVWAIIGGVVFSRVVHVIDKWDYYMANPRQIITFEGLAVYGAVIGIVIAVLLYCIAKKLSAWQIADLVSPGALVGMAIGRVGCLINGCCYGAVTSVPWAVVYTNPASYAPLGTPLHPTQVYHFIWNLAAFVVVWLLRRRLKPVGSIFLLYLALYALGDLGIRFLREGEPFLFGIQQAQLIGIIMLVITVPLLIFRMYRARHMASVNDSPGELTGPGQSQ